MTVDEGSLRRSVAELVKRWREEPNRWILKTVETGRILESDYGFPQRKKISW